MKDTEFMVEKIRSQYTEAEHTELDALKALDAKVKRPARVFGYGYGTIGAIVMGVGMSLVMTDIGAVLGLEDGLVPGINLGVVGMVIGVPLFAVIYDTVKRLVRRGLFRKGQLEVWEQYKADYPDEDSSNR